MNADESNDAEKTAKKRVTRKSSTATTKSRATKASKKLETNEDTVSEKASVVKEKKLNKKVTEVVEKTPEVSKSLFSFSPEDELVSNSVSKSEKKEEPEEPPMPNFKDRPERAIKEEMKDDFYEPESDEGDENKAEEGEDKSSEGEKIEKKEGQDLESSQTPNNSEKSSDDKKEERPPFERRQFDNKKPFEKRPFERRPFDNKKPFEKRPFEKRPFDNKKPFEKRPFDKKPFPPQAGKSSMLPQKGKPTVSPFAAFSKKDSTDIATLELGKRYDYNLLNDEKYLQVLDERARGIKRLIKEEKEELVPQPPIVNEDGTETPVEPKIVNKKIERLEDSQPGEEVLFNDIYNLGMRELISLAETLGIEIQKNPNRRPLMIRVLRTMEEKKNPIIVKGTLELFLDGNGILLYSSDNYKVHELSTFVPNALIKKYSLQRGHDIEAYVFPPMAGESVSIVTSIRNVNGLEPEKIQDLTTFTELVPYYPTERIILEKEDSVLNNLSMRCVDLLCPIGLGQRGLVVAPPRTGKTVLLQTMANSILKDKPDAHLIVLLVDERPEEVTDFKRNTIGAEIISSTFDETPENHVHVAEIVIERARRMVEAGQHVIILLDSITRLARAYNTLQPSGGKILSGGVEAGALTKPKRFFGSARNIENGGSLTILGTALVDTGSKMDEVIFEEFKGTGNMELDLDRDLANKRIFPAINFERSGTRKEELLYHPDEMQRVHSMRRAMKGVPSIEAMEMLINRMKKTKSNIEFLMSLR